MENRKKKVCILYTGGTIGMIPSDKGYVPAAGKLKMVLDGVQAMHHPDLPDCNWEGGFQRIQEETDKFLFSLGYQHIKESGTYQIVKPNEERIALFAHHHFGVGFFSALLDIPYPICLTQFEMCHTGVTVIEFPEGNDGLTTPQILTLSNDSHLYRDGLPTKYNNRLYF